MKKTLGLLVTMALIVGLLIVTPMGAIAEKPGDTVTLSVSINPGVSYGGFALKYNFSSGLEFVNITDSLGAGSQASNPAVSGARFAGAKDGMTNNTITLTLKVKEGAVGDQTVSFTEVEYNTRLDDFFIAGNSKTIKIDAPETPEVWGEWVVKTPAACDKPGVEERTSDKGKTETRPIAAPGHDWGAWAEVKAATCTEVGTSERVCKTDATHKETKEIPALGHDWGDWVVVKAATCKEAGSSQRICKNDAAHKDTRVDKALGHNWGEWTVITPATCTKEGASERICKNDKAHKETRVDPALPHKEGKWEIVKQPDPEKKENGLRIMKCTVGGEILKEEVIPYVTTTWFYNNTATTQGLRFRDVNPELTGKWYMFTPVDLSVDGVQEIPIIASNMYYIGNLTLTVAEGNVTAEYKMARGVNVRKEFLAYFNDISLVSKVEPAQIAYKKLPFGEPVSIEEELKGDTNVLLYTHFVVDYNDDLNIQRFFTSSKEYKALVSALKEMMD